MPIIPSFNLDYFLEDMLHGYPEKIRLIVKGKYMDCNFGLGGLPNLEKEIKNIARVVCNDSNILPNNQHIVEKIAQRFYLAEVYDSKNLVFSIAEESDDLKIDQSKAQEILDNLKEKVQEKANALIDLQNQIEKLFQLRSAKERQELLEKITSIELIELRYPEFSINLDNLAEHNWLFDEFAGCASYLDFLIFYHLQSENFSSKEVYEIVKDILAQLENDPSDLNIETIPLHAQKFGALREIKKGLPAKRFERIFEFFRPEEGHKEFCHLTPDSVQALVNAVNNLSSKNFAKYLKNLSPNFTPESIRAQDIHKIDQESKLGIFQKIAEGTQNLIKSKIPDELYSIYADICYCSGEHFIPSEIQQKTLVSLFVLIILNGEVGDFTAALKQEFFAENFCKNRANRNQLENFNIRVAEAIQLPTGEERNLTLNKLSLESMVLGLPDSSYIKQIVEKILSVESLKTSQFNQDWSRIGNIIEMIDMAEKIAKKLGLSVRTSLDFPSNLLIDHILCREFLELRKSLSVEIFNELTKKKLEEKIVHHQIAIQEKLFSDIETGKSLNILKRFEYLDKRGTTILFLSAPALSGAIFGVLTHFLVHSKIVSTKLSETISPIIGAILGLFVALSICVAISRWKIRDTRIKTEINKEKEALVSKTKFIEKNRESIYESLISTKKMPGFEFEIGFQGDFANLLEPDLKIDLMAISEVKDDLGKVLGVDIHS